MNATRRFFIVAGFLSSFILPPSAFTQVPHLINYQGRLLDGTNLVNATVGLSLRLFNAPSGGSSLYEDSNSVTVADGLYSTFIGDNPPSASFLSALTNEKVWVEVAVNGATLTPRERIGAAAYAVHAWGLSGNAGTSGAHFLGTTDDQPIEIRTLNQRIARFDTATNAAGTLIPNVIFGHSANTASNGTAFGSVIGGGGNAGSPQIVGRSYDTVAGGVGNKATGGDSAVSGGRNNVASGLQSSVGSGGTNSATATRSVIAGGGGNQIATNATEAGILGGRGNNIQVNSSLSVIGGGQQNVIARNSTQAFIGGGVLNEITNATGSVVAGGSNNRIQFGGTYGVIGGGQDSRIGINSDHATIAGGNFNVIDSSAPSATIGGGAYNTIENLGIGSTIAGGGYGYPDLGYIGNHIEAAYAAYIGAGAGNRIAAGAHNGTIGGGIIHTIAVDAVSATIAGGERNRVGNSASYASIGGGYNNNAGGIASTVPGGQNCDAANTLTFAAGNRAKAGNAGAFVWADSSDFDFASTAGDQFNVRAVGGTRIVSGIDGSGSVTSGVQLAAGSGSWTSLSDVHAKENFRDVDEGALLNKLAAMPVREWNYRTQDASIRHIGPTAQDFKAAFGVGETDTGISSVDADGVALAAIQALCRRNAELQSKNAALERRVLRLEERLGAAQ